MNKRHPATRGLLRTLAILSVALMVMPAVAQPGPGPGRPGMGHGPGGMACPLFGDGEFGKGDWAERGVQWLLSPQMREKIGLTQDQADRIQKVDYEARKAIIQLDTQTRLARLDLHQFMEQEKPDRQKLLAQVEAVGKAMTEKRKQEVALRLDLKDILTTKQVQQIKQLAAEHKAEAREGARGRWGRKGAGGPGGPPPEGGPPNPPPQGQHPPPPGPPADPAES